MSKIISLQYLKIAFIVFLSCAALFSLDSDTESLSNPFDKDCIVGYILYGIPTFAACSLVYRAVNREGRHKGSMALTLAVIIPVSFAVIIAALLYWKPK